MPFIKLYNMYTTASMTKLNVLKGYSLQALLFCDWHLSINVIQSL